MLTVAHELIFSNSDQHYLNQQEAARIHTGKELHEQEKGEHR
jgi:hypothetical protein